MREPPDLRRDGIPASLRAHYGLRVASVTVLPVGYDPNAAVYRIVTRDGSEYFLKIRLGAMHETSLLVPRVLQDLGGIGNVIAPLRTRTSELWCPLDGHSDYRIALYPFVDGENAMTAGLNDEQWRKFGSVLRGVHSSGLAGRFRGRLPVETFSLPSVALVRRIMELVPNMDFQSPAAVRLAGFWQEHERQIHWMLDRDESLGRSLSSKSFEYVLCHADIHAANILVGEGGCIHLIDWDAPMIAPVERDLLFVIGSRIARRVEPREERLFFDGYGEVEIDPESLIYYRYERIIEDIGEFARSVFLDSSLSEQTRAEETDLMMSFFEPGGMIETAETVVLFGPHPAN